MPGNFWSGIGAIFTMLISLVFVLFLAWYLLRWMGKKMPSSGQSGSIKILDRVNIGREKWIMIVQAGDKTLLVGMSDNAISTLCEFDANTEFAAKETPKETDFVALLQNAVKKFPTKRGHEGENTDD
ncbi:MAG: flagellar biosynthetic protein FliO [Oscillospiraceae bacterium]